jgi:hypothetical protein
MGAAAGGQEGSQDWYDINPGVRSRMLGQEYDKRYGVGAYAPKQDWSQFFSPFK